MTKPKPKATDGLNKKQLRYVEEVLATPDGTYNSAALRAGYSLSRESNAGAELNQNPKIRAAIDDGRKKAIKKFGVTPERVLQELCLIAFADLRDNIQLDENGRIVVTPDTPTEVSLETNSKTGNSIQKVKTVKLADKIAALTQIGKHIGMFKDTLEVTGKLSLVELIEKSFELKDKKE